MPIYEYACPHCHKTFEEWLRSAEEQTDIMPCPTCGQDAPRIISQTTFILKGGGWYVTEYGGQPKSDESDASEAKPADADATANAPTADEKTGDKASSPADKTAKKAESAPKSSDSALPAAATSAPATPSPASAQKSGTAAPKTSAVTPAASA